MNESLQTITALGSAILDSFWQMGLLWLSIVLYTQFNKKISPTTLSLMSFVALIIGFIAFVYTFLLRLHTPKITLSLLPWLVNPVYINKFITALAWVYLALLILPILKLLISFHKVYHLKNNGLRKVPGHFKIFLSDAIQYLSIKRKVKIFTSSVIQTPLTIGFIKPLILLPIAMVNQLNTQQVEAIILHELAHIKRNDYLQNIIIQIILTLLYFNPFAKMLANILYREREKSADKKVVQFEYNTQMYAHTLLLLAKSNIAHQNPMAVHISSKRTPLRERIEWILGSTIRNKLQLRHIIFSITTIIILITVSHLPKTNIWDTPTFSSGFTAMPVVFQEPRIVPLPNTSEIQTPLNINGKKVTQNTKLPQQNDTHQSQPTLDATTLPLQPMMIMEDQSSPLATFVSYTTTILPELSAQDENKIQEVVAATKKAIMQLSWKIIDKALAETITEDNKLALKEAYTKKIESAPDWEKHVELLRLRYNDINWDKVDQQLSVMIKEIQLDSIHANRQKIIDELNTYKKQIEENISATPDKIDSISNKIHLHNNFLQKLDSIRHKKTIEL